MQAVQRALAHRPAAACQLGSTSHSSSVACRRLPCVATPFTTRRTRAISICAAKKGKASQSKRKSAAKQNKSTAPPAPPAPTPQPAPAAPASEPVATATLTATTEPETVKLTPPPPSPPSEPAKAPPPSPPAAVAAPASSDPIPTHTSSGDIPAGGAAVGGSGVAEDRADTAAQQPSSSEASEAKPEAARPRDGILSEEEIQRLAQLKRQQERGLLPDSNILQGALQEIELITWPTPRKALTDTVLVICIVAATGVLLFGYNILLSQTAEWWYHTPHPDWLK